MKKILAFCFVLLAGYNLGFSINTPIPQGNYTVVSVTSVNPINPVANAFDGDSTTWWALNATTGVILPAILEVDLGAVYDVSGFTYHPNPANATNKALDYEIYVSSDGVNWGTPQAQDYFPWVNNTDKSQQHIFFSSVSGRYVRLIYNESRNTSNGNIHTGELWFYEGDPATGQINQIMSFDGIDQKYATDNPFTLSASSSSGLAITYSVVSGPATISGNTLTLDGVGGTVVVKAEQVGDATYYAAEKTQTFEVVDLSTIVPIVTTRLTEEYPIQMPSFHAYPIHVGTSIDEPTELSVSSVDVTVGGTTYSATGGEDYFVYWWTPDAFGTHTIDITATASNGMQSSITRTVNVTDAIATQEVTTMDDVVIQYGTSNSRDFTGTYTLPQHVGSYDQVMAYLTIECPAGNCDDWDRRANIDVKGPDGNWIQIIRYITPYGIACNHEIDVTDYASLLQGEFEMTMFIDTWGTGGWQITLDFDYQVGTPEYLYSFVDEIWDGAWDLGNPTNLQPVDTVDYSYADNIEKSHLRLSTTGHGWGDNNSQNAAEFYEATNYIDIDGNEYYTQELWNTCNPNPDNCTGQLGTWTFNRAGWCPGAIAHPNNIDLTDQIENGDINLIYRFDPSYEDFCHPDNPNCITGATCPDCNDSYKAVYHVDGQIINFSNTPSITTGINSDYIDNILTYDLEVSPNPTNGSFMVNASNIEGKSRVYILDAVGRVLKTYYFNSMDELNSHAFDLQEQESGIYFISIENAAGSGNAKLILER